MRTINKQQLIESLLLIYLVRILKILKYPNSSILNSIVFS